jgi:hypothetical protein
LTKIIVERWARISSSSLGWMEGQMLRRGSRSGGNLLQLPQPGHVVDGDLDPDLELLLRSGVDDGDRPWPPFLARGLSTAEQPRHLVERPLRRGETDALELAPSLLLEALDRQE